MFLKSCAMSSFFGQILLSPKEIVDLYKNHLPIVIKSANECKFIMNVYYEKEFETDLVINCFYLDLIYYFMILG